MNIGKQLVRNTIVGWFETAVIFAIAMIIPPLLLLRLGKEGYGVWALVGQIIPYLFILDLGVGSSIGRFVAKYNATRDYPSLSRVVSSSMFLFLISSSLIIIITLILWPNFSKFFDLSPEYFHAAKWLILLTGFGAAVSLPLRIGSGMLQGIHRFDLLYFFRTAGALARLLLIVILFGWLGYKSLILLAVITVSISVIPGLFMCRFAYGKFSTTIKVNRKYIKLSSLKEIWSLSLSAQLSTVAALLLRAGQVLCVGKIIGTEQVFLYSIPVVLLTYSSRIISSTVAAFKPMASHVHALDQQHSLKRLNVMGVKISCIIGFFIAIMAIAFGYAFIRIWLPSTTVSSQDVTVMSNVLAIMVIGFAIGVPQMVTDKMLSGTNKHWFVAIVSLAASLIGLSVGIWLMTKTHLGLYGMALGWTTVFVIRGVLVFPISACRHFKIRFFTYVAEAYLPPLAAASILVVGVYLVRRFFDISSLGPLVCAVAFCVAVYAVAVYFICFQPDQRRCIWSMIT